MIQFSTPIFYVNARPHIGHLYSSVLCDALKRWTKFTGINCLSTTGTDEHGLKIQESAKSLGKSPRQLCNEISPLFKNLMDAAQIDYNVFMRTSDARHYEMVSRMWQRLNDSIYKDKYSGWYCVSDETFVPESQVMNGLYNGKKVVWMEEENYMFRLSDVKKPVRDWILTKNTIQPSKYKDVLLADLEQMGDISISRPRSRVDWGIPVPNDPTQTIYVWLDALCNYLTASHISTLSSSESSTSSTLSSSDPINTQMVHVLGKDILKFHGIYWPAFLSAASLPLPKQLIVHGHWLHHHMKMSKSLGNVVDPMSILSEFGVDATRFFLLYDGSLESDAEFSMETLESRYKWELSSQIGNLLLRCSSPKVNPDSRIPELTDLYFLKDWKLEPIHECFMRGDFSTGIDLAFYFIRECNKFLQEQKPWILAKTDVEKCNSVLAVAFETLRLSAIVLTPVMPSAMHSLLQMMDSKPTLENTFPGGEGSRHLRPKMLFPPLKT